MEPAKAIHFAVLEEIHQEREKQVTKLGYLPIYDDKQTKGELAKAASAYIGSVISDGYETRWPWPSTAERYLNDTYEYRGRLIKAAAMLMAEIERLDRAKAGLNLTLE